MGIEIFPDYCGFLQYRFVIVSQVIKPGPNATLYFEGRLTLLYQIQEMLRTEEVFEADDINEELEAYNPMIPDGRNFKATFMIEYTPTNWRSRVLPENLC